MEQHNYNLLVSNLVTSIFMIIACYYGTIAFHKSRHESSYDDFIPLGYIEEQPMIINKIMPTSIKTKKTRAKPPKEHKQQKQKINSAKEIIPRNAQGFTQLQQDCYDALKSLKVTAKESKYLIHTIFNKHDPKTVQDFLQLAFMRDV